MIIVYLIGRFPPVYGGGGNIEIIRNKELVNRGHIVYFLTPRFEKTHLAYENHEGINVIRIFPPLRGPLSELIFVLNAFISIIKLKIKPDLIVDVFPYGNSMLITRFFSKILNIPIIARLSQSGANEPLAAIKGKLGFLRKKLLFTYKSTIAISPDLIENCKEAGIPVDRIALIPDCVDTDLFCPVDDVEKTKLRNRLFPNVQGKIITVVGTVTKRKRPHLAIEA